MGLANLIGRFRRRSSKRTAARIILPVEVNSVVCAFIELLLMLGVHTGEFMGIPPTGKRVSVRFAAFNKIVNGKIVESEVFMDAAGLLVQLGVMPPPKGF